MRGYGDSLRNQAEAACFEQMAVEKQIQNYERLRAPIEARREAKAKAAQADAAQRRRENRARQYDDYRVAQNLLPEIEATGGALNWPAALQKPEFKPQLQMISACLGRWIEQEHTLSRTDRSELKRSLEPLQTHLRRQRLYNGSNAELTQGQDLLQKIDTLVFSNRPPVEKFAVSQPCGK
jgi:hypothetical protein